MSATTLRAFRRLVERWGNQCIVCGHSFKNLACVTREHLVPQSMGGSRRAVDNVGPSHYHCNQHRGTLSLVDANRMLLGRRRSMGDRSFFEWLNAPVPGRSVPKEAKETLLFGPCMLSGERLSGFMELAEWLPGMRWAEHPG
jgi:hypothetical protein